MKEIKCPSCGSTRLSCMDGAGAVAKYGRGVMIDIAPEVWLCADCGESFGWETDEKTSERRRKHE